MRKFEVILSSLAAFGCILLTVYLAAWISSIQPIWPVPALYLIALGLLALTAWFFSIRDLPLAAVINWAIAGLFLFFFILAGFTIGPFYFPFALMFAVVALLSTLRHKARP